MLSNPLRGISATVRGKVVFYVLTQVYEMRVASGRVEQRGFVNDVSSKKSD